MTYIRGQALPTLRDAPPQTPTNAMHHFGDSFIITTEERMRNIYWGKNARLKIGGVGIGLPEGVTITLQSGMQGGPVSVIFVSLDGLRHSIDENCK